MENRNGNGSGRMFGDDHQLARALGWFSLGLGIAQLLAPRKVSRTIGMGDHPLLMRIVGLRELTCGLGILTQPNPATWLKARMIGDAMDLALLGRGMASARSPLCVAGAAAAVAGVLALDRKSASHFRAHPAANIHAIRVKRVVTIDRSPEELYAFWRKLENLPRIMNHLKSVTTIDEKRSHWIAKGPANSSVEWDAEIVEDEANQSIGWRSLPGSDVDTIGRVRFARATGGRGTTVEVELQVDPPAGVLGSTVARLFGKSPEKEVAVDLMRFKQLMETGEISRTEGQPAARKKSTSRKYDDLVRS